ncbi:pectinesterase/pectinesterase inhibitor ppe8b [Phtheirospermum japonicum]|uniref:Pectinesterase n=1 Tax=Phtheirospermum japonicum TaxID=374723 RepID=A0A830CTI8_9LAMI|nr:pectinesterase/pectinesterase inhibitor ppe8b [Phtheirospermum japonicum]
MLTRYFTCTLFPKMAASTCLKILFLVPQSQFEGTVVSTIGMVRQVMTTVSDFSGGLGDFRVNNAVADCLDLMDFSVDLLNSALSVSRNNQNGKDNNTGNAIADMKCWLGGALFNQDTCNEGFDGTNSDLQSLVSGTLNQVTSLVQNLISMVKPNLGAPSKGTGRPESQFPDWLKTHDQKLVQATTEISADAVVAADGTGNYTSIQEAINAAPEYSRTRYVIHIKRGVYNEYVEINKKKLNIMLMGDGMDATVISGNRNRVDGWTTFSTATVAVRGRGFIARDITFENTAGPEKKQAVAFRSDSDFSVLYHCTFRGFQDTLYPHGMRQFYRECKITGTVDFIFGDGTVVFQNCEILARKGLTNQKNTITAQGRKDPGLQSGFSIQFCNISTEPEANSIPTYLGRPWKKYSRTVIMQSYIGSAVRPEGWLEWDGNLGLNTLYYGEYMNYGPGAGLGARVNWPGYHVINDSAEASSFTVAQFIGGNNWLPSTRVKYIAGLGM